MKKNLGVLLAGIIFGIVIMKGEIVSWLRIYEMFSFQSFHMYGIIGSSVAISALLFYLIKKNNWKDIYGASIKFTDKPKNYKAALIGGTFFGLGWAMTGACPGPIFSLIGAGFPVFIVIIISALLGTFFYGLVQHKLPK